MTEYVIQAWTSLGQNFKQQHQTGRPGHVGLNSTAVS